MEIDGKPNCSTNRHSWSTYEMNLAERRNVAYSTVWWFTPPSDFSRGALFRRSSGPTQDKETGDRDSHHFCNVQQAIVHCKQAVDAQQRTIRLDNNAVLAVGFITLGMCREKEFIQCGGLESLHGSRQRGRTTERRHQCHQSINRMSERATSFKSPRSQKTLDSYS